MQPPTDRPTIRIGQSLGQKYRVTRLIGEGAMGFVYAAQTLETGVTVAIKCLRQARAEDRLAVERFRREIRATLQLNCRHIVRTIDVGHLEDGTPFMVMEYLEGRDLAHVIESTGPLAIERAVELALQVCVALAHAHRLGFVHRDIKPANLFLARTPTGEEMIKVFDFGISKAPLSGSSTFLPNLTGRAARLGTPLYVSPEQKTAARDADARADIWSLGITLFEMIAGNVPYDAGPVSIRDHNEPPNCAPSLSRYRSDVPLGLERVVTRCLQRMPQRRFQNVAELARALADFAPPRARSMVNEVALALGLPQAGVHFTAEPSPLSQGPSSIDLSIGRGSTLGPGLSRTIAPTPPHQARWLGVTIAATALTALGGGLYWKSRTMPVDASVPIHAATPVGGSAVPPELVTPAKVEPPISSDAAPVASNVESQPALDPSGNAKPESATVKPRVKVAKSTETDLHSRRAEFPAEPDEVVPGDAPSDPPREAPEEAAARPDLGY